MLSRDARWITAALEGVIAWEWLVSGSNKLLAGNFPQGLAATLADGIKNNPNGWYVEFLQRVVLPNSVGFGYAIEFGELLIGVALLVGVALLIGPVRHRGDPQYRLAVGEMAAVSLATLACAFLCVNFHFLMGYGIFPGIDITHAFNEGVTLDTLMPPLSLIILYLNVHVLCDMTGVPLDNYLRSGAAHVRARFAGGSSTTPTAPEAV